MAYHGRRSRRFGFVLLIGLIGCGPKARVEILRPFESGPRRELALTSSSAYFDGDGPVTRVLIGWPLPGADLGANRFFLYLRLPSVSGPCRWGDALGDEDRVGGLFLEKTSHAEQILPIDAGMIRAAARFLSGGQALTGTFDLSGPEGIRVYGRFEAQCSRLEIRDFERKHEPNVEALRGKNVATQPVAGDNGK